MSLVTVSTKKDRVYQRAFDHDLAREQRAEGWTWRRIAEYHGVSMTAVERVVKPGVRARMNEHVRRNWEKKRKPCKGGCGRRIWDHFGPTRQVSGYCPTCFGELRAAPNVRPDALRCTKCGEWKPDEDFGEQKRNTRRGRRTWCRACESANRRAIRHANAERERAYTRNQKRKGKPMTDFIVLRKSGEGWEEIGQADASSRLHAVEKLAGDKGTYAAISAGQIMEVVPQTLLKVVNANGKKPTGA